MAWKIFPINYVNTYYVPIIILLPNIQIVLLLSNMAYKELDKKYPPINTKSSSMQKYAL